MTTPIALQLRRSPAPPRAAVAWFLAGPSPVGWLEELTRWRLPLDALKCFVTPAGRGRPGAGGLLVLLPDGAAPADARGLALGRIGAGFYLPVDAELFPPVTTEEVRGLSRAEVTLFHPGLGLVEFDLSDACGVWEFLAPPEGVSSDWNAAQAGAALSSRLTGVAFAILPGKDEIFSEEAKDIGSEPIVDLPERPREPSPGLGGKMGRSLTSLGAGAINALFSLLPKGGKQGGWINNILDWASAKLTTVSKEVEDLRNRELLRLMHMLETDPERGLRHALPFGGDAGRGRTAPGAHLGTRDINFNLRNIGGSGRAADPWDVPWEMQQKLRARYRELALQEQRQGRFKRAAYIHAELLGDLNAAAAVLKEGRYFAEAAVLYRDHLRQTQVAAECFAAAALFAEAMAIYEKEKCWLQLGDLQRRLGDETAAVRSFQRLVDEKLEARDYLAGAELLEDRLRSPAQALAVLRDGWPASAQAILCLKAEFALLARQGWHEETSGRLASLRQENTSPRSALPLGEILDQLRATYPEHGVRRTAADLARVKLSPRLASDDLAEIRAGAQIIGRLAPEDRLLARDATRFALARAEALRARPPALARSAPDPKRLAAPQFVRTFTLAGVNGIGAVRRCGRHYFGLIQSGAKLHFVRGDWTGVMNVVGTTERVPIVTGKVRALVLDEQSSQPGRVVPLLIKALPEMEKVFEGTERFPQKICVGRPAWLEESVVALALSGPQWWVLRWLPGELLLDVRTENGRLTGSFTLTGLLAHIAPDEGGGFSMIVLRTDVWLAIGSHLFLVAGGAVQRHWQCESNIVGLVASPPFLPRGVVAHCAWGVAVFWHENLQDEIQMLASDYERPLATFLGNGMLVLIDRSETNIACSGRVFDLDRRGIHGSINFTIPDRRQAVGLVATDQPDEFAVFFVDSTVQIWTVSGLRRR